MARIDHPKIEEGKDRLARLFETIRSVGPEAYAASMAEEDLSLSRQIARLIVNDLLDRLP